MWLAAENGMFLRHTKGEWMTTMPEHSQTDWINSVKVFRTEFLYYLIVLSSLLETHFADVLFPACLRVFHRKNTQVTFL